MDGRRGPGGAAPRALRVAALAAIVAVTAVAPVAAPRPAAAAGPAAAGTAARGTAIRPADLPDPSSAPTPTPPPEGTPGPEPTATPTPAPTVAPTATPTVAPTATPTVAPTPAPTATAVPRRDRRARQRHRRQERRIDRMIRIAKAQVGEPYHLGAQGPSVFDCSGLVWFAFRAAHIGRWIGSERRSAEGYETWGRNHGRFFTRRDPRRGDLVIWGGGTHIGINIGRGRVVSAVRRGVRVHRIRAFSAPVTGFVRIRPD